MQPEKANRLLRKRDFVSMFFRSLLIQAVWNFKSLISIGLCFAIIPVARRLYHDKQDMSAFLKRHLYFFNAHPFFASFALGAVARLEEDRVLLQQPSDSAEQIEKFKNALIGPLGAVGDQYFWAVVKPASILVGFAGVTVFDAWYLKLTSLLVMLILYNVPHLMIRIRGLLLGYRHGFQVYRFIQMERFQRMRKIYLFIGASALGLSLGFLLTGLAERHLHFAAAFVVSALLVSLIRRRTKSFYLPVATVLVIAVLLGLL